MFYLSSCSIVKNESPYIKDFYTIHKFLGVERFVFYDRTTEGTPLNELFKDCSDVDIIPFNEPRKHAEAWATGCGYFQGKSKWVQFVDIDQVVVPMKTLDIKEMLQDYEQNPSLGLNWHSFGSSGRETEPNVPTYEAYTMRAAGNTPINNHIQSIVQVEHCQVKTWNDPHHPPLNPGSYQFNERKEQFNGPFNIPPSQNVGFIAHYYTRNREYWAKKCAKLRCDTLTQGSKVEEFDHHQSYMNAVEDLTVKNIWDQAIKNHK